MAQTKEQKAAKARAARKAKREKTTMGKVLDKVVEDIKDAKEEDVGERLDVIESDDLVKIKTTQSELTKKIEDVGERISQILDRLDSLDTSGGSLAERIEDLEIDFDELGSPELQKETSKEIMNEIAKAITKK